MFWELNDIKIALLIQLPANANGKALGKHWEMAHLWHPCNHMTNPEESPSSLPVPGFWPLRLLVKCISGGETSLCFSLSLNL